MDYEMADAWTEAFETYFAQFAPYFRRSESRISGRLYVRGLLADVKRKNCWQLAEALGLPDPRPLQRVLHDALWNAEAVGQRLRQVVIAQIGYEPGIGVIDESGVVKKGDKSAGVARQYCGRVGKVENCQVGVYLGYVTPQGAAFLDRCLYLPKSWCADRERRQRAAIPDEVAFQTKPELAQAMLAQVWDEGIPMQWVVGDTLYGNSPGLRDFIDHNGRYYVLALGANHHVIRLDSDSNQALKDLVATLPSRDWSRLAFRLTEKGVLWHEWAAMRVRMPNDTVGEQWLVIQRTLDDPIEHHFFLSNAPAGTPLTDLAAVALSKHPIEQLLEEAKGEVGLADYEVRHWHGWHRHITLALLAHTFLKLIQHDAREKKPASGLVEFLAG